MTVIVVMMSGVEVNSYDGVDHSDLLSDLNQLDAIIAMDVIDDVAEDGGDCLRDRSRVALVIKVFIDVVVYNEDGSEDDALGSNMSLK